MGVSNQQKNIHLLWRAGFGPAVEELSQIKQASPIAYFKALTKSSAKEPAYRSSRQRHQGVVYGSGRHQ
jgi:hypothetical protein